MFPRLIPRFSGMAMPSFSATPQGIARAKNNGKRENAKKRVFVLMACIILSQAYSVAMWRHSALIFAKRGSPSHTAYPSLIQSKTKGQQSDINKNPAASSQVHANTVFLFSAAQYLFGQFQRSHNLSILVHTHIPCRYFINQHHTLVGTAVF